MPNDNLSLREQLERAFDEDVKQPAGSSPDGGREDGAAGQPDTPPVQAEKQPEPGPDKAGAQPEGRPDEGAAKAGGDKKEARYRDPPSRWSKEAKEAWAKAFGALDEANPTHKQIGVLRDMVMERWTEFEQEASKAEQLVNQVRQSYEGIESVIGPRREHFRQSGTTPERAIAELFQLSDFATARPDEFVRWFVQQRGIDPVKLFGLPQQPTTQEPGNDPDDPLDIIPKKYKDALAAIPALHEEINRLRSHVGQFGQQWGQYQQTIQEQQVGAARSTIESFASAKDDSGAPAHPYYSDPEIRNDMIYRLENGLAATLEQAYDAAVWANPRVRAQLLETQQARRIAEQERAEQERARRARVAGSSVSGGTGGGGSTGGQTGGGSLRELLSAAYDQAIGRAEV